MPQAARDLSAYTVVASLQHVHGCLSGVLANWQVIPPYGILGQHWPRLQPTFDWGRAWPPQPPKRILERLECEQRLGRFCMFKKQASKRKRCSKAIPILGAAGLSLTLTGGVAAAAEPTPNTPARNATVSQEITLREDEISDVSLATFHVFDKEGQAGKRLACGCGGGCCLFARAPSSALGNEVYSTQPRRQTGRTHKHIPTYP